MTMSSSIPSVQPLAADSDTGAASTKDQRVYYWMVPLFFALFGIIFVPLGRVMPPPDPNMTVVETARFLHDHAYTMQVGFVLLIVVMGLFNLMNGLYAVHLKRTTFGQTFTYMFLASQAVGVVNGCLWPAICLLTAALRPDRSPDVLVLLYDMSFLSFIGTLGCFATAYLALIFAVLSDRNGIFPRWFAYVSIWNLVTEIVAAPIFFFQQGVFAWNGAISFWVDTIVYVVWQNAVFIVLFKAIKNQTPSLPAKAAALA
jgi:hypothetical protein